MQGQNRYQKELFTYIDISSLIPENHILKKIDKVLDLSFVRELTADCYSSTQGRPSIDPELFFRMLLIAYIFGIEHDRKLCEEVSYNLAYRWYCRLNLEDNVPDHSSLSKIRDRYGKEIFEKFFAQILALCKSQGLVKGERIMTDSTFISADASIESLIAKDEELRLQEQELSYSRDITSPPPSRAVSNKTHISSTDPDSTLATKRGKSRELKYKNHCTIDADSRVILDVRVSTGSEHDTLCYLDDIKNISDANNFTIKEAIADRAYGSLLNLSKLQEMSITTYIPLFTTKVGQAPILAEAGGFIYDSSKDIYTCPTGQEFKTYPMQDGHKIYRGKSSICNICSEASICAAKRHANGRRAIIRNPHHVLILQELERLQNEVFISRLKERMWKIEGIFAEAKNQHTLSRARYRGLPKVQIQAYMVASVQNLKRIVNRQSADTFIWLISLQSHNDSSIQSPDIMIASIFLIF